MNRFAAGALGGLLATVPMTLAMEKLYRVLPREERYPLPPREITENVVARSPVDRPPGDRSMAALSLVAHFAYGAAAGALYGAFLHTRPRPVRLGASFGVAVWAASYLGWIPAANILRPATQHPQRRNLLMLTAHCVWGASTAAAARLLADQAAVPALPAEQRHGSRR